MIHESSQNDNTSQGGAHGIADISLAGEFPRRVVLDERALPAYAEALAMVLKPGDVLALRGNLGAGKTTFTQALCKALGVQGPVTSPTFTLIQHYQAAALAVCHVDAYRVDELPAREADTKWYELDDILAARQAVVIVEWPEKLPEGMLVPTMTLSLAHLPASDARHETAREFVLELLEEDIA